MRALAGLATGAALLAACGGSSSHSSTTSTAPPAAQIQVSSPAFAAGGSIPALYACDGRDLSLPLRWSGVPAGATELTLTMRDPDAPGGAFLHWSLSGVPASTTGLSSGRVPAGAVQGRNGFGSVGYRGPCPPPGEPAHHYVITLSALAGSRVLATGELIGTYARR